jgi:serine/threonine-protein kinase
VYSLGVVLYEAVCGRPPFKGDDALAVAYQHVQEQPDPPRHLNADIETTLEAIILKCLAKSPQARYPSAEDLRADLRRYREGNQIAAPTPPPPATVAQTATIPATAARATYQEYQDYDEYDDYDDYQEPPRRNGAFIAILLLLLLVLGGVLYLLADQLGVLDAGDDEPDGELVTVPNVVGDQLDEAKRFLEAEPYNFVVQTEFEESPDFDDGEVISQDPERNTEHPVGGTITLTVSNGEPQLEVPEVIGFSEQDARSALEDEGFSNITAEPVFDDSVEPGHVVSQDPAPGENAPRSAPITLRISQGPERRTVPSDLPGRPADDAERILTQQGFTVTRQSENSASVPRDTVIRTEPAGGTELEEGGTVTLIVSAGPEQVIVPSVTEKTEETATTDLRTAGFEVEVVDQPIPPGDPDDGRVLAQDPQGGTSADKGSTVTITVGRSVVDAGD